MSTSTTSTSADFAPGVATGTAAPAARPPGRRVTDAATRMLHWLMALSFTGAYLTADGERWRLVHVSLGYTLAGLFLARLLWGIAGPRQVRLAVLMRKVQGWPAWLKSLAAIRSAAALQPVWRQGQNLLMGLAVLLILGLVAPLALSGYAVWSDWGGEWLEEIHELLGNAMLAVVLAHIGLIALLSVLRRKNQALPMLTGRLAGAGPDLAKRNHGWLAALVLACVLGFWGWQWSQAPQGTAGREPAAAAQHQRSDD